MADQLTELLEAVQTKLKTASFIADPDNVIVGETHDFHTLLDADYPRLETLITKQRGDGLIDQYSNDERFLLNIAGYIKRANEDVIDQDMYDIMNAGTEVLRLMFSFHQDTISGSPPCRGFLMLGGYYDLYYEYEFIYKVASFILEIEFKLNVNSFGR